MNKSLVKPTIILAVIAFIATFALSHIKKITYPSIQKQERQKRDAALMAVLPGYTITEEKRAPIDNREFTYWIAEKIENNAPITAYAFVTEKGGYSGPVRSMVGIDKSGRLLGIAIIQQSETPGLGARAAEIASTDTFWGHFFGGSGATATTEPLIPWFQEQFSGLDTTKKIEIVKRGDWNAAMKAELLEKNSISSITGATITTKAVRDSIENGVQMLDRALQTNAVPTDGGLAR